ncbi:MAG: NAD(P)H-dependent oxidoreductase subunit E [Verrucomicrobia bacterium]|nr:NAD(P)H-dependent oxidoreductase subunit E [Verrucomicrobiota bacterium]
MALKVPSNLESEIDAMIARYPVKRSASVMLLHAVQDHFGYVSQEAIEWIAAKLELQPINILELVTFYPMFRQERAGRHQLKICRTLSCALGGSHKLRDFLCEKLGLARDAHGPATTEDGKFTIEFVECLASCGTPPVMMCNQETHENVTPEKAERILEGCK